MLGEGFKGSEVGKRKRKRERRGRRKKSRVEAFSQSRS